MNLLQTKQYLYILLLPLAGCDFENLAYSYLDSTPQYKTHADKASATALTSNKIKSEKLFIKSREKSSQSRIQHTSTATPPIRKLLHTMKSKTGEICDTNLELKTANNRDDSGQWNRLGCIDCDIRLPVENLNTEAKKEGLRKTIFTDTTTAPEPPKLENDPKAIVSKSLDKLDILKTGSDGTLYLVHRQKLKIEKAYPPRALAELTVFDSNTKPMGAFLSKDETQLLLIGNKQPNDIIRTNSDMLKSDGSIVSEKHNWRVEQPKSRVELVLINIRDKESPEIISKQTMDGRYVSDIVFGAHVQFVTTSSQ